MAELEEVRSKLKARLSKYKVQTPTRVAYLGDGRGNATSNMVPPGEPDKYWARESLDGDKPFKVLNRNPDFTPAFNLPVLLGYPEDDPTEEQVMGLHRALIKFSIGNAGSALGGVAPHHTKHEWGGGDEVFVDPRQIKPGLVKPTAPASMSVKILSFQHYWNDWDRYDGGTTDDMTQYKPSADYRYVLITLDPTVNQIRLHPGNVFTPDLSIDSIISKQANNTFRHIPIPPGNEIPLGCVLLQPTTTKIDWNINGVNNLLPMRILLGSPMKEINERLSLVEAAAGITTVPTTGAANNNPYEDLLPARIDGNITRFVHNRASASQSLPVLLVGEFGYVNSSPSQLIIGTASGNQVFVTSGGAGAGSLSGLDDVTINSASAQHILKYTGSEWINSSAIGTNTWPSAIAFDYLGDEITVNSFFTIKSNDVNVFQAGGEDGGFQLEAADTVPGTISIAAGGNAFEFGGGDGDQPLVELNGSGGTNKFLYYEQNNNVALELDPIDGNNIFFRTAEITSALDVQYDQNKIIVNSNENTSPLVTFDPTDRHVTFGSPTSFLGEGVLEFHSPSNLALPVIGYFNHATPGITSTTHSYHFKNSSGSMVTYFREEFTNEGGGHSSYSLTASSAGVLQTAVFGVNTAVGEVFINQGADELSLRVESSANNQQFKVDGILNAVQIGTSVAGQIADFRDHLIEFNKNANDTNVKMHGTSQNAFVIDAGANRIGIGTDTPTATLYIDNTEVSGTPENGLVVDNTYSPSSDPGTVFPGALNLLADYDSTITPAGGFQLAQFLRVRNVNSGVLSARCLDILYQNLSTGTIPTLVGANIRTPTNSGGGAITTAYGLKIENQNIAGTNYAIYTDAGTVRFGGGLIMGAPTGGDKGAGTINVAGDIYKNNVAYTSPDYALEYWATGRIDKYKENQGAVGYRRLSLDESEQYVKENFRLPRITDSPVGIFDMADIALEKIEELHTYIYELNHKIKRLESELENKVQLENKLNELEARLLALEK